MGGYIKAGKEIPDEGWLLSAGAEIAKWIDIRASSEAPESVTRDMGRDTGVTGIVTDALLGGIWRLWGYADANIQRDNSLPITLEGAAQVMRLPVWMLRFIPDKWFCVRSDGFIELPNYCEKNNVTPREERKEKKKLEKENDAERQRRSRAKRRHRNGHGPVTGRSRVTSRARHGPVTPPTGTGTGTGTHPIPVPETEAHREVPASSPAALASALGHLARPMRPPKEAGERHRAAPTKTPAELEADARKLAAAGQDSTAIARMLGQYGVTNSQVTQWLANAAPEPNGAGETSP
jgi:hypothetical protein